MAGYARSPDVDRRPLGDIIALTKAFADTSHSVLRATGFGSESVSITGDLNRWGTPDPYECLHVTKCVNQQSHLDDALEDISHASPTDLSVMVSDFWFDNRSFTGTPAVALSGPLRSILSSRSVAIVGLRVPFKGDIYDMPGSGTYKGAHERVLILLVAGPEIRVRAYVTSLIDSHSRSFDGLRQTLFKLPRTLVLQPPTASGAGVRPLRGETGYLINWSSAHRNGESRGRISRDYSIDQLLTPTVAGRGALRFNAELHRADLPSAPLVSLPGNPWRSSKTSFTGTFDFGPQLGAAIAGKYVLIGRIGTMGIASPDPAAAWMREWSLESAPGRPSFVKAQGLDKLADILEQVVSRPAWLGQFSLRVDIED